MIRHLLKIVWRRKRANTLVAIEIFFSFLVVFAVVTAAVALYAGWNRPLGFEWKDVWVVSISGQGGDPWNEGADDPNREALFRLLQEIRSFPQVVSAGFSEMPPFGNANSEGEWLIHGRKVPLTRDQVGDGFGETLGIQPVRGRWFNATDDALDYRPVVVDADLAKDMYLDEDPIGKKFDEDEKHTYRVIGVIPPYRKHGEFSLPHVNMVFFRKSMTKANGNIPRYAMVRVRPGTGAEFEARLMRHLLSVNPNFSIDIRRLDRMRESANRSRFVPLVVTGIIALFLIAMVALGLTGVLWQNVTRRTREVGLRRAVGASGTGIRWQILAEVALLATLAVVLGVIVVAQFPLLGIFSLVTPAVFTTGIVAALAVIYGITLASGLYPSWLASRLTPAEALRYE